MKTNLLLLSLLGLAHAAAAQEIAPASKLHTVSVGIFGLAPTAGFEYEHRLGRHGAVALQGSRYFNPDYLGYQAALVGRCYFSQQSSGGLYLQLSAGAFTHQGQARHSSYPGLPPQSGTYTTTVHGQGGGLGLGYRWPLGPQLSLNTLVGLKFYFHDLGIKGGPDYVGDWYATGQPGSVLDAQVSVGYSF
ncbi:hypothetical protein GKZ68_04215 [Hymenobacter sp. BRD128]|uniref:hypothetical protein n=1 Tax=Hymenobacter sp. BRD128 TaxID=2675878 RepID=UPI0015638485|nr:hypothetical protein [Hymenobacter sp. BRD128]QKG55914.1 hypothetical protein GKZ68_04215 [Hymenobacter sp. BRD128]